MLKNGYLSNLNIEVGLVKEILEIKDFKNPHFPVGVFTLNELSKHIRMNVLNCWRFLCHSSYIFPTLFATNFYICGLYLSRVNSFKIASKKVLKICHLRKGKIRLHQEEGDVRKVIRCQGCTRFSWSNWNLLTTISQYQMISNVGYEFSR